jgi:hypothetical protein
MRTLLPDNVAGLITGPVIWSLYFVASYMTSGFGCSVDVVTGSGAEHSLLRWLVVAEGVLAMLLIVLASVRAFRGRRRAKVRANGDREDAQRQVFLFTVSLGLCGFSLVGVLWLMTAAVTAPVC